MKKILSILLVLAATLKVNSQNVNACNNAQNICSNPSFLFQGINGNGLTNTLNISNPTTNPQLGNGNNPTAPANSGCLLTGGPGPQWLILTVSTTGNLGFIFGDPTSPNPQVGLYDWMMWPFTPSTCANIFNNTLPPVSCNWNASSTGGTGMGPVPVGGNVGNYQPSIPVTAGQQFLILISNYSGINSLVSFTSTGTASLTCGFNYSICAGNNATITPVGFVPLTNQTYTLQPLGLTNSNGTFVVTPTVTTTYTIYGSGLNSQSVQATQTSTTNVVLNPQPSAAPTTTQMTCLNNTSGFNLNPTFNPATPVPSVSVNWSPVPYNLPGSSTTAHHSTLVPGTYNATVTAAGGCSTTTSFTILPQPAPAAIDLIPVGPNYMITCFTPTLTISALDPSYNYTWTNGLIAPILSPTASINFTGLGTWTITAVNPVSGCSATKTISIGQNTTAPVSVISPSYQVINCNLTSVTTVTLTSTNPTVNITHQVLGCSGGAFSANNATAVYQPGGPCTYTHVLINNVNGCTTVQEFTVFSTQGFPVFNVSSPQNFTLGCTTKSVATINISLASTTPTGGAISFTMLPPGASSVTPPTPLGTANTYTVNSPGTYTMITKDNVSLCETRVSVSVLTNTLGPTLDTLIIPRKVLDCFVPRTTLRSISETPNVSYNWTFPGSPGNQAGDSLTVFADFSVRTATVIDNYTLTLTDNNNTCITRTIIPIYQNIFLPKAQISNSVKALTCNTGTIELNNFSSTGIQGTVFPSNGQVIGYLWEGPSPQEPKQISSSYMAWNIGIYTLTVMDMNNGCMSSTTTAISDNRLYPVVNKPTPPPSPVLDCGSGIATITVNVTSDPKDLVYQLIHPEAAQTSTPAVGKFLTDQAGDYRVVTTNTANGCATGVDIKVVLGKLKVDFTADRFEGYAPLVVTFSNTTASTLGSSGVNSVWSFGNGSSSVTPSASLGVSTEYKLPGTYKVTLYASKGTCFDTTVKMIKVDIPSLLEIPNAFTPNNDNVNDLFFLKTANISEVSMKIFDRWGHMVYDITSQTGNVAWDGKNQSGVEVAEGTYFYILKGEGRDGKNYEQKGTISLFR